MVFSASLFKGRVVMWCLAPPFLKGGWEGFTVLGILQMPAYATTENPPQSPFSKGGSNVVTRVHISLNRTRQKLCNSMILRHRLPA